MSTVFFQFGGDHVCQHGRREAGRVGIHEEEKGLITQKLSSQTDERMDGIFNFPDFPLWSPAIGRRIHDDTVIVIAAADLALYKFSAVIHEPADRRIAQAGGCGIFLCPSDHALRGIDVCDSRACLGCCKGGTACVGEEIQHLDRAAGIFDFFREPVPVCGLLREKTGVLEAEGLELEGKLLVVDAPLLWKIKKLPLSATLLAAVIMAVRMLPAVLLSWRIPDDLRIRAHEQVIAPALQLFSTGGI